MKAEGFARSVSGCGLVGIMVFLVFETKKRNVSSITLDA